MDTKQLRDGDFFDTTGMVFKYIKESWEAFKLNWQIFVGALILLVGAALLGVLLAGAIFGTTVLVSDGNVNSGAIAGGVAALMLTYLVVIVLGVIIAPLIVTTQLASVRNKKLSFSEAFEKSKSKILGFLGLALLMALTIIAGFILLIIPGFLAIFFLTFAPYIYIDKKIGAVDAMKASYELVKEYWKVTMAIYIVNIAVSILMNITILGQIASIALSVAYFCLGAVVYAKIAGKHAGAKEAEVVKN